MAIHPLLPGIEVAICVNDEPLPEYDDDESQPSTVPTANGRGIKTITKYIESTADHAFAIDYTFNKSYKPDSPTLNFCAFIDGIFTKGTIFKNLDFSILSSTSNKGLKKKGRNGEQGVILPYQFAKIETSQSEVALSSLTDDRKTIEKSGRIVVEVFRCSNPTQIPRRPPKITKFSVDPSKEVHEKALKGEAKYHGASLGDALPAAVSDHYQSTKKLDGKDSPILRFIFKYRSREALRQLLIIERESRESPLPNIPPSIDLDHLDGDQRRQVESFVRNLTQSSSSNQDSKVKRERNEDGDMHRPKKKQRPEDIELVDLTGD